MALWDRLLVPLGFPGCKPGGWKDSTRALVSKAAADLEGTTALLERVSRSPWLRDTQRPDLLWVLRDGRERIEGGRFDDRGTHGPPPGRLTTSDQWLNGIDCTALTPKQFSDLRSRVMCCGSNQAACVEEIHRCIPLILRGESTYVP